MSRSLRIRISNGIYHVTSRGLERRDIFYDDADRKYWLLQLDSVAIRRDWSIFAWVIMDNHTHLFLRTPHPDISDGIHELNSAYGTAFNRRHKRVGPLFQGRFKGILVERGHHYWELSRYIHLNPVRAGMVDNPEKYKWSSCCQYFRSAKAPPWLAWEEILIKHGKTLGAARKAYREYLHEGVETPPESPLKLKTASTILGSPAFVEHMKKWLGGKLPDRDVPAARKLSREILLESVVTAVQSEYGVSLDQMKLRSTKNNEPRSVAIYLCRKRVRVSIIDLGNYFGGVSGSAISKITKNVREHIKGDNQFRTKIKNIENFIDNSSFKT